jgi:hypothetical protein
MIHLLSRIHSLFYDPADEPFSVVFLSMGKFERWRPVSAEGQYQIKTGLWLAVVLHSLSLQG